MHNNTEKQSRNSKHNALINVSILLLKCFGNKRFDFNCSSKSNRIGQNQCDLHRHSLRRYIITRNQINSVTQVQSGSFIFRYNIKDDNEDNTVKY